MSHKPRVLVVEDHKDQREDYMELVQNSSVAGAPGSDISGFVVRGARSVEGARKELEEGWRRGEPIEAVLLDLGLPETEQDAEDELSYESQGWRLLKEIREEHQAAVIILTVYGDTENILQALRRGAADFFHKTNFGTTERQDIIVRLVHCVGGRREAAYRERHLKRIQWLLKDDWREYRERVGRLLRDMVGNMQEDLQELRELLTERYGLQLPDDAKDPVCLKLAEIGRAANELPACVWEGGPREPSDAPYGTVDVVKELVAAVEQAWPCYAHRNIVLKWNPPGAGSIQTKTSLRELGMLLEEFVLGPLFLDLQGDFVEVSCEPFQEGGQSDVRLKASFRGPQIPDDVRDSLNNNELQQQEMNDKLNDKWRGLHFVQRSACNLGAKFLVESDSDQTIVTVRIPVIS